MKNEPVRHHYVPRFLLKPFCFEGNKINYYDKKTGKFSVKDIKNIFVEKNFYRDDINNENDPMKLEKDFAKFESEVSRIFRKFLKGKDIIISIVEYEEMQFFFALMMFRGKNRMNEFSGEVSDDFRKFYSHYQKDENFNDFWKRNLGYLANCRSIYEVMEHSQIDDPIKLAMFRDTKGASYPLSESYFVVAEKQGNEELILSEEFCHNIEGEFFDGTHMTAYTFIPISPQRILIRICNGVDVVQGKVKEVTWFNRDVIKRPQFLKDGINIKLHVNHIYAKDVRRINATRFGGSTEGVAFRDKSAVSIDDYPSINNYYGMHNS